MSGGSVRGGGDPDGQAAPPGVSPASWAPRHGSLWLRINSCRPLIGRPVSEVFLRQRPMLPHRACSCRQVAELASDRYGEWIKEAS